MAKTQLYKKTNVEKRLKRVERIQRNLRPELKDNMSYVAGFTLLANSMAVFDLTDVNNSSTIGGRIGEEISVRNVYARVYIDPDTSNPLGNQGWPGLEAFLVQSVSGKVMVGGVSSTDFIPCVGGEIRAAFHRGKEFNQLVHKQANCDNCHMTLSKTWKNPLKVKFHGSGSVDHARNQIYLVVKNDTTHDFVDITVFHNAMYYDN